MAASTFLLIILILLVAGGFGAYLVINNNIPNPSPTIKPVPLNPLPPPPKPPTPGPNTPLIPLKPINGGGGGITPLKPIPPPPSPAITLIVANTIGFATSSCSNAYFYGALTDVPVSITANVSINNGPIIPMEQMSGDLKPFSFNPNYANGFDAFWTGLPLFKVDDTLCFDATVNSATHSQKVSQCFKVSKCSF